LLKPVITYIRFVEVNAPRVIEEVLAADE